MAFGFTNLFWIFCKLFIFHFNITFNEQAIKNTDTDKLRSFLVQQGVDYSIVDNAFGWHERMVVLFNMKNIISKQIVTPKEKIETFDLPTAFTS